MKYPFEPGNTGLAFFLFTAFPLLLLGQSGQKEVSLCLMTLLVLLPTSARAGIVAPDSNDPASLDFGRAWELQLPGTA
jgi:hypothetical protein